MRKLVNNNIKVCADAHHDNGRKEMEECKMELYAREERSKTEAERERETEAERERGRERKI